MAKVEKFEYRRQCGVVWVCDLAGSSGYLNDDETVEQIEAYLPRLYWISLNTVEAAGGKFIKWTGDGFLAWFRYEDESVRQAVVSKVIRAAEFLSFVNRSTQLGLNPQKEFQIRHGITNEKDALILDIVHENGHRSLDLIGRAVVLAFRLSAIKTPYPAIFSQEELVKGIDTTIAPFIPWKPTQEMVLKYFKNEQWGLDSLYSNYDPDLLGNIDQRWIINLLIAQSKQSEDGAQVELFSNFWDRMRTGPAWCHELFSAYREIILKEKKLYEAARRFFEDQAEAGD